MSSPNTTPPRSSISPRHLPGTPSPLLRKTICQNHSSTPPPSLPPLPAAPASPQQSLDPLNNNSSTRNMSFPPPPPPPPPPHAAQGLSPTSPVPGDTLEAQLRGMIVGNQKRPQTTTASPRQPAFPASHPLHGPLFMAPGDVPPYPHILPAQQPHFSMGAQACPPHLGFPAGYNGHSNGLLPSPLTPLPHVNYQQQFSHPQVHGLQYSPRQQHQQPVSQSIQSPPRGMGPDSSSSSRQSAGASQVTLSPHRSPTQPQPFVHPHAPNQRSPDQGRTDSWKPHQGFRQARGGHKPQASNSGNFSPPGTASSEITSSPPPQDRLAQRQPRGSPNQRHEHQNFPTDSRNNRYSTRGAHWHQNPRQYGYNGEARQQPSEEVKAEQNHWINEAAKKIIQEASPSESEMTMKRDLLLRIEKVCRKVFPDAELVPFGSLVTGFATASSDLDVIFTTNSQVDVLTDPAEHSAAPNSLANFTLPLLLEKELQAEGFEVQLLTKTRVPILKLVQNPTEDKPLKLHCDIGFSNHLAIHNTQLLLSYSRCDPRVKEMVIFVKWWARKRRINNPYRGTLSSYGYALMIIHYLVNITQPPVLQNLQTFVIPEEAPPEEIFTKDGDGEHLIWFYKAISDIPPSKNKLSLGALLRGFFEYYAYTFQWGREVVSIRTEGGILMKQQKGWVAAVTRAGVAEGSEIKDRYLFAIEDPFEITHNVSRTCNMNGVNKIREEFKRSMRVVQIRDGGISVSKVLCIEAPEEKPWVRREDRDKIEQKAEDNRKGRANGGPLENKVLEKQDTAGVVALEFEGPKSGLPKPSTDAARQEEALIDFNAPGETVSPW